MGNAESASDPQLKQRRSLSPRSEPFQTKALPSIHSSFHSPSDSYNLAQKRIQQRRAKSFRVPRRPGVGGGGSFRAALCPISGLTAQQKRLIENRWTQMDRGEILEMGKNVFEILFRREPQLLRFVGIDSEQWRNDSNFRIHIQRFCETMNSVIRRLDDPRSTLDRLQEFGAAHFDRQNPKTHKLSASYWEALTFAINNAAKDLQIESSRGSESPVYDRRFLTPNEDSSTPPSPSPSTLSRRSVCPTAAEAWNLFAIYSVAQMRFGYEMERLLLVEIRRLEEPMDELSIKTNAAALNGSLGSHSSSSAFSSSSSSAVDSADCRTPLGAVAE